MSSTNAVVPVAMSTDCSRASASAPSSASTYAVITGRKMIEDWVLKTSWELLKDVSTIHRIGTPYMRVRSALTLVVTGPAFWWFTTRPPHGGCCGRRRRPARGHRAPVSYTHLRAHET